MGVDAAAALQQLHNATGSRERSLALTKFEPVAETGLLGGEMTKNLLLMTCASSALVLMAGAGHAATAAATDNSQGTTNVTELVVTAEKRETSLQKVPVAVSVFTGAERDTIGINTVADVTNFAPGFSYDPANVHAFIRGIGRQSVNVTNDQRVANYEDEFYVYSPYGLDKSSLFLSQEQIERGPQNVGGRNAEGGSIDMISVRPTDQPYGEVRATLGNFGTEDIEAAASGQIAPGLDVRIAGFDKNQNDGYYTNVLPGAANEGNRIHEWYTEGQLDWKPNDQFEFWARAFAEGWDGSGDAGSRVGYNNGSWDETSLVDANAYVAAGLFVNPNYGYAAINGGNPAATLAAEKAGEVVPASVSLYSPNIRNNPSASDPYTFASPTTTVVKLNDYNDFNYIATYHAPGFDIKYTGGVQGYSYHLNYGSDTDVKSFTMPFEDIPGVTPPGATPLVINPQIQLNYEEDDYWTAHDLTFQSTTDSPLQWTAGGFAYYQHYNQPYQVSDPLQPQLASPLNDTGTAAAAPNPLHQIFYYDYNFNVQSYGGYAQVSYKLNDQFKITGDVRYSYDDKYGSEASRYIDFAALLGDSPFLGSDTPALDITPIETCLSGNPKDCNSAANGLGRGVTSLGVIGPNGYATRDLGITSDAVTGGAGIDWTPTSDIFAYFRYDRGYASPSFNAGLVLANPATQPEYINSYQVGYKESFGKSLLVDLAGFYYDYDGLQLPVTFNDGGVTSAEFINVPNSITTGFEAEVYWTPVNNLVVTLSYSFDYTDIQTKCFGTLSTAGVLTPNPNAVCLEDTNDPAAVAKGANPFPGQKTAIKDQGINGAPLPDAPENKFAIDLAYTFHFEPGSLTLSGDYVFRGSQDGTVFNRSYDNAPSWDDVDLRALWKSPGDRYEVIAYMKNVFNTLQYTVAEAGQGLAGNQSSVASPTGAQSEVNDFELNPPRTFGVEVRYKFF
jgi:iron complex outermembrane receptor protein